ncbi:MAG: tRNA (adenosine(37)-N6)-dimethylallyltransferase MiaA [Candidatus Sumerlaeia bacterium]|nr:tRNA (adenosine(37)-N6)-dimethylallyltransferase MiaA [Candidatus Sumerlaeia bacterium]
MHRESYPPVIIIGGPTGVGKTDVGVELALRCGGEIISADSMQVYRRFQIGTAKPTPQQCRGIPYHGIDLIEPTQTFHLGAFIEMADRLIAEIAARGRQPLIVGGTGLYIKGLLQGVFDSPPVDAALRRRLLERAKAEGAPMLHAELARVDPPAAARISPNDPVRIVRALEVWEQTGRPISALWAEQRAASGVVAAKSRHPYYLFVLYCERAILYERINRRVEAMFHAGLADEVRQLLAAGVSPDCHAFKALGYRHVLAWIEGRISEGDAIAEIQKHTRHYAKRQLTWFRAMTGAQWIDVGTRGAADVAAEISARVQRQPPQTHI